jgi:Spy/CpxP family protein refolding chaperone
MKLRQNWLSFVVFCSLFIVGCQNWQQMIPGGENSSGSNTPSENLTPSPPSSPSEPDQAQNSKPDGELTTNRDCLRQARKQLNLSTEQKQKIRTMAKQELEQLQGLLVDEKQKQDFQNALQTDQNLRNALKSLNLSPDQRKQLRTVLKEQRRQFVAVLTPEQQKQLELAVGECKQ